MRISWIAFDSFVPECNHYTSAIASLRYRATIPSQYLAAIGHDVIFHHFYARQTWNEYPLHGLEADILVFSKSGNYANERAVQIAKSHGAKVIFDISDNYFAHTFYGKHYHTMTEMADQVVVPTRMMAQLVEEKTGRTPIVIPDPVEGTRASPSICYHDKIQGVKKIPFFRNAKRETRLQLLWFGSKYNLPTLYSFIPELLIYSRRQPVDLHVVTDPNSDIANVVCQYNSLQKGLHLRFTPWSLDMMEKAFQECDIVIIPSNAEDKKKKTKSPNRLVESVWAGRFVVAHPIPCYMDYEDCAWIGDDLTDGIRWALSHPDIVVQRILKGQNYIGQQLLPETISKQWVMVFEKLVRSLPTPEILGKDPQLHGNEIKLNLGCGDKILPGFINVDIAENRNGKRPNLICDLHRLSISDRSVDEILSVHVIEHFWRWEVMDILREWFRVLRPGGHIIIECPNLLSACEELLKNPRVAIGYGIECQRSLWVFYGDPAWRDPLMVHRWGYTPTSLGVLLGDAGFIDIRQEPAQFKLREPRDMRVTGVKPLNR